MSKGSLIDSKAESKVHHFLLPPSNQPRSVVVDEPALSRRKSGDPLEDRSVQKLMTLAKELAWSDRQQAGRPAEDRPPREEERESDSDRHVETPPAMPQRPKGAMPPRPKAAMSPRPKRKWELIVGCYILLVLGAVVFSVWVRTGAHQVAAPAGFTALSPPKSDDPIATPQLPGRSPVAAATNEALRFGEFGCASVACTLSCNANERIANAFALSPGGTFVYEDDRTVTFRPLQLPSSKIVLVCSPQ
jgi:hypothetical protein